jgi:hypothetical protein
MLEYIKLILEKVSFDCLLFEKELKKAFNFLAYKEVMELWAWCNLQFAYKHPQIIDRCFGKYAKSVCA